MRAFVPDDYVRLYASRGLPSHVLYVCVHMGGPRPCVIARSIAVLLPDGTTARPENRTNDRGSETTCNETEAFMLPIDQSLAKASVFGCEAVPCLMSVCCPQVLNCLALLVFGSLHSFSTCLSFGRLSAQILFELWPVMLLPSCLLLFAFLIARSSRTQGA